MLDASSPSPEPLDGTAPEPAQDALVDAYSRAVAEVADRVGPAVVRVQSAPTGRRGGFGSGVVIAGDGLVLTNSHVVAGARRARIGLAEGGEREAELLGDDPASDLALLRTELPRGASVARLGDSKRLRRGHRWWASEIRSASSRPSRPASSPRWAAHCARKAGT